MSDPCHDQDPMRFSSANKVDTFDRSERFPYRLPLRRSAVVEVADCFGGFPGRADRWSGGANPVTGPIEIAEVRPGETIGVHMDQIEIVGDGLMGSAANRTVIPIDRGRGVATFPHLGEIPLRPHIGTIGIVPSLGVPATHIAGDHGGNMDCNPICAGAIVCFRVQVPGAGLGLGDTHAVMGDGETGGQGVEVASRVTLWVDRVPGLPLSAPYGICAGRFFTLGWGDSLESAADMAQAQMLQALIVAAGTDERSGWKFLGAAADLRVCWRGGPIAAMRMELPVAHLAPAVADRLLNHLGVDS